MSKRKNLLIIVFLMSCVLTTGCAKFAVRMAPSALFHNLSMSLFEECDTQLAESAIPANLKIMEGFLKSDPKNKRILRTLSSGFSGYSLLFVEESDPARASELYIRAFDYGMRSLGHDITINEMNKDLLDTILRGIKKSDHESFLWTVVSWNSWIMLNLDKPVALAQSGLAFSCIEKLLETDPDYLYGIPFILMGTGLSARPPMLGGDYSRAEENFEKALDLGDRGFFLAHYFYARYYCTGVQNRDLFIKLLNEVIEGDPGILSDVCLINSVIQEKAAKLLSDIEEFFI